MDTEQDHVIRINTPSDISEDSLTPAVIPFEDIEQLYTHQLDARLDEIRSQFTSNEQSSIQTFTYHESNSPLSMSDGELEPDEQLRQLSYREVEQSLDKYYDDSDNKYSSELDILITYMKGQKNLFYQAYLLSQRKLNCLLIPALLVTSAVTIFAPIIENYKWSGGIISGLNAFTVLLISLSNYLKLETSTQTFYSTALHFEKLETSLEFVASKLMFIESETDKSRLVFEKIQEIETKISEIKEWNTLFLPDEIRKLFPIICNINVFSFIKRMESNKKLLVARFKDVKNELRYISICYERRRKNRKRLEKRLEYLNIVKEKIKDELGYYRNAYSHIDEIFTIEINRAQNARACIHFFRKLCGFRHSSNFETDLVSNPIVDKYIHHSCPK